MAIPTPHVHVECDRCQDDQVEEIVDLTPLIDGDWSTRNVKGALKRCGWRVTGDECICPECIANETSEEN